MHINILYSTDENYVYHAGVSLYSLLENNKEVDKITVYIVDNNISEKNKEKLKFIAKSFNREINFIPIQDLLQNFKKNDDFPISGYARLFITKAINVDKVLYIDCDTIINGSLEELWNINIDNYLVAGVQDNPAQFMVELVGMDKNDRYINSGVLLINLKKWREYNIEDKFLKFVEAYKGMVPHHDQGIINGVCRGKILVINPKFNMMPQFLMYSAHQIKKLYDIEHYYSQCELDSAVKSPIIIHYISKFYNRPWFEDCTHPLKNLYKEYFSKTGWQYEYKKSNLSYKVKLRKWVFDNMPFPVFYFLERLLDVKRKRTIKKLYSNILK